MVACLTVFQEVRAEVVNTRAATALTLVINYP